MECNPAWGRRETMTMAATDWIKLTGHEKWNAYLARTTSPMSAEAWCKMTWHQRWLAYVGAGA
jgi:hypothetical protein